MASDSVIEFPVFLSSAIQRTKSGSPDVLPMYAAAQLFNEAGDADGIRREQETIAQEEAKKARLLVSAELQGKARELADLEKILKTKDEKLADAQKAQAELLRKQRELDDAKRELEPTVEQRAQESLGEVRDKARREAEEEPKLKVAELWRKCIAGLRAANAAPAIPLQFSIQ